MEMETRPYGRVSETKRRTENSIHLSVFLANLARQALKRYIHISRKRKRHTVIATVHGRIRCLLLIMIRPILAYLLRLLRLLRLPVELRSTLHHLRYLLIKRLILRHEGGNLRILLVDDALVGVI